MLIEEQITQLKNTIVVRLLAFLSVAIILFSLIHAIENHNVEMAKSFSKSNHNLMVVQQQWHFLQEFSKQGLQDINELTDSYKDSSPDFSNVCEFNRYLQLALEGRDDFMDNALIFTSSYSDMTLSNNLKMRIFNAYASYEASDLHNLVKLTRAIQNYLPANTIISSLNFTHRRDIDTGEAEEFVVDNHLYVQTNFATRLLKSKNKL
jgi:hypothetical protein